MNLHLHIISTIRRAHAQTPLINFNDLFTLSDIDLIRRLFRNYRGHEDEALGLRLSPAGLIIMRSFFQCWQVRLDVDYRINSKDIIFLDRICTMPWHLESPTLTLFEPELAMRAKLCGNLDVLRSAFS